MLSFVPRFSLPSFDIEQDPPRRQHTEYCIDAGTDTFFSEREVINMLEELQDQKVVDSLQFCRRVI